MADDGRAGFSTRRLLVDFSAPLSPLAYSHCQVTRNPADMMVTRENAVNRAVPAYYNWAAWIVTVGVVSYGLLSYRGLLAGLRAGAASVIDFLHAGGYVYDISVNHQTDQFAAGVGDRVIVWSLPK